VDDETNYDPSKDPNMMSALVNGKEVWVPKGSNVMAACEAAGIDIPRFCYHPKLSIAGNCRMCLVDLKNERGMSPKPVASCAMPLGPGTEVLTDTDRVKKAREGVMEFLLLNHPLDCPICDQGGECDLQDQAMHFGSDRGRFVGQKRSVVDKNLGPLVKTVMTRCIHCTRCVRYATEVAGVQDLGVTGRGGASEIGTYVAKLMESEMSGNVIDLCPVGALTSKPYAFTARQWELKPTESIDVSDALGCNIRVDTRGTEVMRILPRNNESVNEDWISDKARFQYDGLQRQRLNVPMIKGGKGLKPVKWNEALEAVKDAMAKVEGSEMKAIAGKLADAESLVALKDLMNRMGCENLSLESSFAGLSADIRSSYLFNSTISGIDKADAILLIGSNPRKEAPVLNARIRKANYEDVPVGVLGEAVDLTFATEHVGTGISSLKKVKDGKSAFAKAFAQAAHPMVIVGPGVLQRPDRDQLMAEIHNFVESAGNVVKGDWNGYNILHDAASRVGALDVGFVSSCSGEEASSSKTKFVYLLGADDYEEKEIPKDAFVVYQGHHGDAGANRADVILPGAAYTEKPGLYVNSEGRVQQARRAVPPLGEARDDWKIVRALSEVVGQTLPYNTVGQLHQRLQEVAPHFAQVDTVPQKPVWLNGEYFKAFKATSGAKGKSASKTLKTSIENFYMTDVVSRASRAMAKATQARQELNN
jgi:NADH dehydrogenase (ubiquinone) Fe-S protein 1